MNLGVGKYVYAALNALSATVYPVVADFNSPTPTTPFMVYQRTAGEPQVTKSLWNGEIRHDYTVTVADNQYTSTLDLAQQAIDALIALTGTEKDDMYIKQVMLTDISEDFADGLFLQNLKFKINTIKK